MSSCRRVVLLSSVLACLAPSLRAQAVERAIFLVRLGRDTLAVENAIYAPGRTEAMLRLRNPVSRIDRRMMLSASMEVRSMETTAGLGVNGDSARTHVVFTAEGDSGRLVTDAAAGGPSDRRRIAVPRGAVPFTNLSGQTLELILRRARFVGGDTVDVPLLLSNGQSLAVRVSWVAPDSALLSLGGVGIRARTDREGRLLGAFVPAQGAFFDRLPGDSPVASWTPVRVSYEAPLGAPYVAEQVTLRTPAGITLAGTLTMPVHPAGTRVPAAVLITGSGPQERDEAIPSIGNYRPFREIADTLSRRGIAVLRLDDRGMGGSDAGPPAATSADFADDIRAALVWLRARADVDPRRVALVGHSEGGLIAPMIAASDSTLRAIALVAAPAVSGRAIMAYQRRWAVDHDASIARVDRDSALAAIEREVERLIAAPGWLHFFAGYDPIPALRRVRARTLILQGETDRQITAEQAGMIAAALRDGGNRDVSVHVFPRMNHLMLDDESGDPAGYGRLRSYAVRRDFMGTLVEWLAANL
jgi:uncharacterized protein